MHGAVTANGLQYRLLGRRCGEMVRRLWSHPWCRRQTKSHNQHHPRRERDHYPLPAAKVRIGGCTELISTKVQDQGDKVSLLLNEYVKTPHFQCALEMRRFCHSGDICFKIFNCACSINSAFDLYAINSAFSSSNLALLLITS